MGRGVARSLVILAQSQARLDSMYSRIHCTEARISAANHCINRSTARLDEGKHVMHRAPARLSGHFWVERP